MLKITEIIKEGSIMMTFCIGALIVGVAVPIIGGVIVMAVG